MKYEGNIHDIAAGGIEALSSEDLKAIPVLKPPKKSFCPKCGSDIHANTMLQWRKWRDSSSDVVSMQMEAAMETALIEVASHYVNVIQALKDERDDAVARAAKTASETNVESLREKIEAEVPNIKKNDMTIQFHEERIIDLEEKNGTH